MNDIITLYHGSIADFEEVDVKRGRTYKDFGQGFYCSETRSHAVGIAVRDRAMEILLEVLMPDNLPPQTFFATIRAVSFLTRVGKERF